MSLRTATVASSDSDGRFAEYFASDGRRYFYDTWFNTVVWSKDNATKAAVKKQDKDPGQKTGQKTDDDDATLGAFPAPRPDDNPGIHGGAWYRDAETGEVIFETPPPPPDPGNVDNDGRPQPITEDSLYTQLVNIRGGLAWSAGFSWVCGPQQDTRCTRYCVDHETDSGGWILMARAHVMRVASKNSPGLRQREKDFLRRNETAPAARLDRGKQKAVSENSHALWGFVTIAPRPSRLWFETCAYLRARRWQNRPSFTSNPQANGKYRNAWSKARCLSQKPLWLTSRGSTSGGPSSAASARPCHTIRRLSSRSVAAEARLCVV